MQFVNMKDEIKYIKKRYTLIKALELLATQTGCIQVEPDYFEPYDQFIEMNKRIKREEMVKIIQNDGSISILRPDITTNIIKQIVPKWMDDLVLKIFYTSTTFSQKIGLPIKEEKQFGVEFLGDIMDADPLIVQLMINIFEKLHVDYMIEIGNQRFLNALFKGLNLSATQEKTLKQLIDLKDRSGLRLFIETLEISSYRDILEVILKLEGSLESIIEKLKPYKLDDEMHRGIEEFMVLNQSISNILKKERVIYDLSLISKFDYYEGITYKGYLKDDNEPVLNGGRYDPLTQSFGKKIKAIGFSIQLSPLIKEVTIL